MTTLYRNQYPPPPLPPVPPRPPRPPVPTPAPVRPPPVQAPVPTLHERQQTCLLNIPVIRTGGSGAAGMFLNDALVKSCMSTNPPDYVRVVFIDNPRVG